MNRLRLALEQFRQRLAYFDALPQLVILGIITGFATAIVIILFRLAIRFSQQWLLPDGIAEDFESLSLQARFLYPVIGALLLILLMLLIPKVSRPTGIVHLLARLNYYQGRVPLGNFLTQFFASIIALGSGQSVGREGPAVYLGGSCSSLLGQVLHLPHNTLRIMIGCGTAAAISAVFNTPLAGVIFAMEVILLEYNIIGFTPIIVSAVVADVFVELVLGSSSTLTFPTLTDNTLLQLPALVLLGLVIGAIAALFISVLQFTLRFRGWKMPVRFALAGLLTGVIALQLPQVMGTGYDSIEQLFDVPPAILLLFGILAAKTLLTPVIIALGIPGGIIGPSLVIGALTGALLAQIGRLVGLPMSVELLTIIGMGAMMGAILNAPLAALMALLEFTDNSAIIVPGMLAIVISNLTVRSLFKRPSVFQATLQAQGLDIRRAPLAMALSRAAVGSLMRRGVRETDGNLTRRTLESLLTDTSQWFLIKRGNLSQLMPPGDLLGWLNTHRHANDDLTDIGTGLRMEPERDNSDVDVAAEPEEIIDLMTLPANRQSVVQIPYRATLLEAWQMMNDNHVRVLLVISNQGEAMGTITHEQIEDYYNHKQL